MNITNMVDYKNFWNETDSSYEDAQNFALQ